MLTTDTARPSAQELDEARRCAAQIVLQQRAAVDVFKRLDRECHLTGEAVTDPVEAARLIAQGS